MVSSSENTGSEFFFFSPLTSRRYIQGLGIALVAAQKAEVPVTLIDNSQASLDKGLKFAGKNRSETESPVNWIT